MWFLKLPVISSPHLLSTSEQCFIFSRSGLSWLICQVYFTIWWHIGSLSHIFSNRNRLMWLMYVNMSGSSSNGLWSDVDISIFVSFSSANRFMKLCDTKALSSLTSIQEYVPCPLSHVYGYPSSSISFNPQSSKTDWNPWINHCGYRCPPRLSPYFTTLFISPTRHQGVAKSLFRQRIRFHVSCLFALFGPPYTLVNLNLLQSFIFTVTSIWFLLYDLRETSSWFHHSKAIPPLRPFASTVNDHSKPNPFLTLSTLSALHKISQRIQF